TDGSTPAEKWPGHANRQFKPEFPEPGSGGSRSAGSSLTTSGTVTSAGGETSGATSTAAPSEAARRVQRAATRVSGACGCTTARLKVAPETGGTSTVAVDPGATSTSSSSMTSPASSMNCTVAPAGW